MKTFKDNMHQPWNLELGLTKVRRFREVLGLDLLNPTHYMQVLNSLTDRLAFVWLLCEKQAKEFEVTIEDFEERLCGDGFADAASIAFLEECAAFFLRLGQIPEAKLTAKNIQAMQKAKQTLGTMVKTGEYDSILDSLSDQMDAMLRDDDGNGSSNSQPSQDAANTAT